MWCFEILLASSLIFISSISADRNNILVKNPNVSWISAKNFEILIDVSFTVAKCANIFINGTSAGTEKLFNDFVQIYPYEYTVNRRIYGCNGYFMISQSSSLLVSAMIKVPTTISTTELLVIVDDEVEESSGLFNVSMYQNANVNIAARNGLWTLSENFLEPRIFEKVIRYRRMEHKRGVVNLQGRELQIAAFYSPPLCYLRSTDNMTVEGIEGQFFTLEDPHEFDGIETRIFSLIADRLNFTYKIRKPNDFYRYGRQNGTNWKGGMIGQMFRKEVDMAFTGIWMTLEHYRFVNLTKPWTQLHLHFLVPRPRPYASFWALTRPLSPDVWSAVIAVLFVQSVFVYTAARVNPRTPRRFRSFTMTWTEMMGRMVGTWAPRRMEGLELQFQLWHFTGVLIVTAYSSSLAASLTSSGWEKRIDTPRQFIAANLTWGREGQTPNFPIFFDASDSYARQFPDRFQHEKGKEQRHEKILKGNYAILGSVVGNIFFPDNEVDNDDLKGFRLMRQKMSEYYSAFAVQPWLLEPVDTVMLWLRETGLAIYQLRDVLHRRAGSALREVLVEHDGNEDGARPLKLVPLGAGFCLYFVGLLASAIVFYFELKAHQGTGSVRDVLIRIRKNREKHDIGAELERKRQRTIKIESKRKKFAFVFAQKIAAVTKESNNKDSPKNVSTKNSHKNRRLRVRFKSPERRDKLSGSCESHALSSLD